MVKRHSRRGMEIAQIKLDNFGRVPTAAVLQSHTNLDGIPRSNFCLLELQIRVLEATITQAKAEGIERLFGHVAIGASLHAVIIEGRQLVQRPGERDGE